MPTPQIGKASTAAPPPSLPTVKAERARFVCTLVRDVIGAMCTPPRVVKRGTLLGPTGIGHGPEKRKQYAVYIKESLAEWGGIIRLTPGKYADDELKTVGDICDLVFGALE